MWVALHVLARRNTFGRNQLKCRVLQQARRLPHEGLVLATPSHDRPSFRGTPPPPEPSVPPPPLRQRRAPTSSQLPRRGNNSRGNNSRKPRAETASRPSSEVPARETVPDCPASRQPTKTETSRPEVEATEPSHYDGQDGTLPGPAKRQGPGRRSTAPPVWPPPQTTPARDLLICSLVALLLAVIYANW